MHDKSQPRAEVKARGAPPKARAQLASIKALMALGMRKAEVARSLNIGIASVYRILKEDVAARHNQP